jgi:outer membrane protein assembly factor BamB
MLQVLRIGLGSAQLCCGLLALLCGNAAVGYLTDSGRTAGLLIFAGLGIGLLVAWSAARTRRRWLIILAITAGLLAVAMIIITVLAGRAVRFDLHAGVWGSAWLAAFSTLAFTMITIAAVIELRLRPWPTDGRPRAWAVAAGAAAPLALIIVITLLLASALPSWMVRANSRVTENVAAAPASPSELSGSVRWAADYDATSTSLVTAAGLAVPLVADRDNNPGMIMVDPVTGRVSWHWQLRGAELPPAVASTDQGRSIVASFGSGDLPDGLAAQTFTLNAETGNIQAFWPDEIVDADPPVVFHQVANGTNSVSAISATGKTLWTYRPKRCADPRGAQGTPAVVLVTARNCGSGAKQAFELLGLDAGTGDRLWTRPTAQASVPTAEVVRRDFQIELAGQRLQRRNLTTGAISWSVQLECSQGPRVTAAAQTLYVDGCPGDDTGRNTVIAYDLATGRQLWRQPLGRRQLASMVAVDDQRVLALIVGLAGRGWTCRADLLGASTTRVVQSFPEDYSPDLSAPYRPGTVHCATSTAYRVAGSVVLQIDLATPPRSNVATHRYRLIGLA